MACTNRQDAVELLLEAILILLKAEVRNDRSCKRKITGLCVQEVFRLLQHIVHTPAGRIYPLERACEAVAEAQRPSTRGRVLLSS